MRLSLLALLLLVPTARAETPAAVSLCEASEWGRGYRAGCRDICTIMTLQALEEDEPTGQGLQKAQQHCGTHCYEFCIDQVEKIERSKNRQQPAPQAVD